MCAHSAKNLINLHFRPRAGRSKYEPIGVHIWNCSPKHPGGLIAHCRPQIFCGYGSSSFADGIFETAAKEDAALPQ